MDYIQIPTRPTSSHPSTILHLHNMIALWPDSRFPGKLFWDTVDDTGESVCVSKILFIFNGTRLGGLIFEYDGGRISRNMGYCVGEVHGLALEEGEVLSEMAVAIWGDAHAVRVSKSGLRHFS
jgi:hypothetical protein